MPSTAIAVWFVRAGRPGVRRHLVGPVAAVWLTLAVSPAAAQGPEWTFTAQSARSLTLPEWLAADSVRMELSYDPTDSVQGFRADLNLDGTDDYVLRYSINVCGSNCQYDLVDGRTHALLGTVGGSVLVVRARRINGYPVINEYSHSSADAGLWGTAVFDGRVYVHLDAVRVEGASLEALFDSLKDIPFWPPPVRHR